MQWECCHWDRKKTPAIKDATPADGLSRCLGDERRYWHIPFSRQLLVGRAVRHHLISGARRVQKIEPVSACPIFGPRNRYRSSDRSRRLAYPGFLLSGIVMSHVISLRRVR